MDGTSVLEASARRRRPGELRFHRLLLVLTLVVALVGMLACWTRVDRLDQAGRTMALVWANVGGVDMLVGARIDEAAGVNGLNSVPPGGVEDGMEARLNALAEVAGVEADRGTEITDRFAEMVAEADDDGRIDGSALFSLTEAIDRLTSQALDEAAADLDDARQSALVTVTVSFILVAALATLATTVQRSLHRPRGSAGANTRRNPRNPMEERR
jgi:hypothetical protein